VATLDFLLPWERQPQSVAEYDAQVVRQYGIVGGALADGSGQLMRNAVSAAPPILENTGRLQSVYDAQEVAASVIAGGGASETVFFDTGAPHSQSFTFLARVKYITATTGAAAGVALRGNATTNVVPSGTSIWLWRTAAPAFDMRIAGTDYAAAGTWNLDQWYDIEIVGDASGCTLYVDGVAVISGAAAASATLPRYAGIGDTTSGVASDDFMRVKYLLWANRPLTVDERRSIRANPYQLFEPQTIWMPVSAAGAAAYTLTAATATFTLTGNAATLKATRKLTAEAASFALTGNAAGLLRGLKLTAAAASYAWTAQDAGLRASRVLSAAVATYALTGNAATLKPARLLSAVAASYTFTGNAATLTYTPVGSYSLTADAAAFAWTGNAAGLRADRKLTAAAGIFAFTGNVAGLLRSYRLAADVQTYAWTGNAASLTKTGSYSIQAEAASFAWVGNAAALTYSGAPAVSYYPSRTRLIYTQRLTRSIKPERITRSIKP